MLQLSPGCIALFAPDCRSWGCPARGTSFRNGINAHGIGREFVVHGNLMASRSLGLMPMHACNLHITQTCMIPCMHEQLMLRMVLLCLLCLANHAIYVVEQPRQSLLYQYFRWQWLQNRVSWVPCLFMHACMYFSFIDLFMHIAFRTCLHVT